MYEHSNLGRTPYGKATEQLPEELYQCPVNMKNNLLLQGDKDEKDIPVCSSQRDADGRCHSSKMVTHPEAAY